MDYLIKFLYTKLTGAKLSDNIKSAPPRCSLKMFGGELSIEEFREGFDSYGMFPKINMPPMIPLMHVINNNKFL